MSKIGNWLFGGVLAAVFLGAQKIRVGVSGVFLNGMITTERVPLKVVLYLMNSTIGRVLVRSVSGSLFSGGQVVATINQVINRRINANSYVEQPIYVDIHSKEALQALMANIQGGDINTLSFEFIGEVVIGEQWPVGFKFNRVFTWADIQGML